jgi:hypothetical protein
MRTRSVLAVLAYLPGVCERRAPLGTPSIPAIGLVWC